MNNFCFVLRRTDGKYVKDFETIDDRTEKPIFTDNPKRALTLTCYGCSCGHLRKLGRPADIFVYKREVDAADNITDTRIESTTNTELEQFIHNTKEVGLL